MLRFAVPSTTRTVAAAFRSSVPKAVASSPLFPSGGSVQSPFFTNDVSPMMIFPATISVRYRSNRSRRGMYDGKDVRSGHHITFSGKRTKRKFKPNVQLKRLYSEVLDEMIKFHVTAATLKSIDKVGGLDHYLLTSNKVKEGEGYKAKQRILHCLKEIQDDPNNDSDLCGYFRAKFKIQERVTHHGLAVRLVARLRDPKAMSRKHSTVELR